MEWQNSMHALCANSPRCVCFSVEKSAINSRAHPLSSFFNSCILAEPRIYQTKDIRS